MEIEREEILPISPKNYNFDYGFGIFIYPFSDSGYCEIFNKLENIKTMKRNKCKKLIP